MAAMVLIAVPYMLFLDTKFWKYFWVHVFILTMINTYNALLLPPERATRIIDGLVVARVGFTILGAVAVVLGTLIVIASLKLEPIKKRMVDPSDFQEMSGGSDKN
ncbi:MAG: hypothetical protein ABEK59_00775 [Halobacteria archaeon]